MHATLPAARPADCTDWHTIISWHHSTHQHTKQPHTMPKPEHQHGPQKGGPTGLTRPPRLCARRCGGSWITTKPISPTSSVSRSDHATTPREAAPRHQGRPSRRRGRRREDRLVERRECARGRGKTSHIKPNPRGHGEAGFIEAGRRRLGRNLPTRRAATTAAVAAVWAAHPSLRSLRSRRPGSRNHLASRSRRAQTRPCTARRCLAATPRAHRPHGPRARS